MESRELPRIVTAEAQAREVILDEEHPRRSRFARLDFVRTPRKLDWIRIVLTCIVVCTVIGLGGYGGRLAIRSAVAWLHAQPRYQLDFTRIQLDPPAPPWIRGGNQTVLQTVLKNSGEDKVLSVPALETGRLTDAFKKSPWVEQVESIRFSYPNQVVVNLKFRKPVALIKEKPKPPDRMPLSFVLDEEGYILPPDEIDPDRVSIKFDASRSQDSLIEIQTSEDNPNPPKSRAAGTLWKTTPVGSEPTLADLHVRACARLAGFLKRKQQETKPALEALKVKLIYHLSEADGRAMVVYNYESDTLSSKLVWGKAPGEEVLGSLSAEEKWTMLKEWARSSPRQILQRFDEYWVFQKDGLKPVTPTTAANR